MLLFKFSDGKFLNVEKIEEMYLDDRIIKINMSGGRVVQKLSDTCGKAKIEFEELLNFCEKGSIPDKKKNWIESRGVLKAIDSLIKQERVSNTVFVNIDDLKSIASDLKDGWV